MFKNSSQWRIQDFPDGVRQPPSLGQTLLLDKIFAENCMKMKGIGPINGKVKFDEMES